MIKTAYNISFVLLFVFFLSCKQTQNPDFVYAPTYFNFPERQYGYPQYDFNADNPLTEEGIKLGRFLFYDPILSEDGTKSCASCHKQENAFADSRQFSVGVKGNEGKRNSMALFNLMWHPIFFWDGRVSSLREQVIDPIENPLEMGSTIGEAIKKLNQSYFYRKLFYSAFGKNEITKELYSKAMEQFLFTIISFDSEFDKWNRGEPSNMSESAIRGMQLFNSEPHSGGADCFHCHGNIQLGSFKMSNNGLDEKHVNDLGYAEVTGEKHDEGKFKVVSLRNVELTKPYMHDGRFNTLEEVIDFYVNGVHGSSPNIDAQMDQIPKGLALNEQQKEDLIAFLKSLTDYSLINNPKFSNPF